MKSIDRRQFLKAASSLAAVAATGFTAMPASAQDKVGLDEPTAKALNYVEDASKLDAAKVPTFKKGSRCDNCALYDTAKAKGAYGPCAAFPGKLVAAAGWCSAYAPKA